MNAYRFSDDSVTIFIEGESFVAPIDHPRFQQIISLLKVGLYDKAVSLIDVSSNIEKYTSNVLEVRDGQVLYKGMVLNNVLTTKILELMELEYPYESYVLFLENLLKNPSKRAVDELFGFLEYGKLPITEDGCFLAYRFVRKDYTSFHPNPDGTYNTNRVGDEVRMERNEVDDNKDRTCSTGLHFCSYEYLPHTSMDGSDERRVVIVKINPADVVSIPSDYNNTKGRCCFYKVVAEKDWSGDFDKPIYSPDSSNASMDGYSLGYERGCRDAKNNNEYRSEDYWSEEYTKGYEDGYDFASLSKVDLETRGWEYGESDGYEGEYNIKDVWPQLVKDAYKDGYQFAVEEVEEEKINNDNSGYLKGRERGTDDAINGRKFKLKHYWSSEFSNGYRDGYNDNLDKTESYDNVSDAYKMGYKRGQSDVEYCPQDYWSIDFREGYDDGYFNDVHSTNHDVDEDEDADTDFSSIVSYEDSEVYEEYDDCDEDCDEDCDCEYESEDYRIGYADGKYEAENGYSYEAPTESSDDYCLGYDNGYSEHANDDQINEMLESDELKSEFSTELKYIINQYDCEAAELQVLLDLVKSDKSLPDNIVEQVEQLIEKHGKWTLIKDIL